jgi:hypothetical protein
MKKYYFFIFCVLFYGCDENFKKNKTNEQILVESLKHNKIEKFSLVRNYSYKDDNEVYINWKEFNKDFRLFKILVVDTMNTSDNFYWLYYYYGGILSNCKELLIPNVIIHYNHNEVWIYRRTDKNERRSVKFSSTTILPKQNSLAEYVKQEKGKTISWLNMELLIDKNQKLIGFNSKKDSLEFIISDIKRRYVEYGFINPNLNEVFCSHIPLDTVIKCNLFIR